MDAENVAVNCKVRLFLFLSNFTSSKINLNLSANKKIIKIKDITKSRVEKNGHFGILILAPSEGALSKVKYSL
jgi:hypothetical protein